MEYFVPGAFCSWLDDKNVERRKNA